MMRAVNRLVLILLVPLMLLAVPVALLHYLWAVFTAPGRALKIAIGFDQIANAALNGDENETISSRAARARDEKRRWGCVLCRFLDSIDPNHCNKSRGI